MSPLTSLHRTTIMLSTLHFVSLANALVVFTVLYLALRPSLQRLGVRRHLMVLVGIHMFRYIGLTLALPNQFDYAPLGVPERLALQLGYWDFTNGLLALTAFVALQRRWSAALPLTWLFVIVAMLDQLISGGELFPYLTDANRIGTMPWLLVAVYLPVLVVTSVTIIVMLSSNATRRSLRTELRAPDRAGTPLTA
jgi:hypothetical protein